MRFTRRFRGLGRPTFRTGLEVPGSRSIYRVGGGPERSELVADDQQLSFFDPALGACGASGKLDFGTGPAASLRRLGRQVRAWSGAGGDFYRTRPFSGHGVSSGQLAARGGDARPNAAGSLYQPVRAGKRHLCVSAGEEL